MGRGEGGVLRKIIRIPWPARVLRVTSGSPSGGSADLGRTNVERRLPGRGPDPLVLDGPEREIGRLIRAGMVQVVCTTRVQL